MLVTLTDIKDVVLICTSITTIGVTFYALNKWKKEHKGKTYFECAYKCLKALYTIRDCFNRVRSPFIGSWEYPPHLDLSKENERERTQYIFKNRLAPLQEALNEYYSLLPEVEVLLSKEVRNTCDKINAVVNSYNFKLNEYLQLIGETNNTDHLKELRQVIFKTSKRDNFENELNQVITNIEKIMMRYIRLK